MIYVECRYVFAISITGMILIFRGLRSCANWPPRWCRRGTLPESGRQKQRGHSTGAISVWELERQTCFMVKPSGPSWVVRTSLVKQVVCHFQLVILCHFLASSKSSRFTKWRRHFQLPRKLRPWSSRSRMVPKLEMSWPSPPTKGRTAFSAVTPVFFRKNPCFPIHKLDVVRCCHQQISGHLWFVGSFEFI